MRLPWWCRAAFFCDVFWQPARAKVARYIFSGGIKAAEVLHRRQADRGDESGMTAASLDVPGTASGASVRERSSIAGVVPPATAETTIMSVWPSLAAFPTGQFFGRLYLIDVGAWPATVGNLIALASVPVMLTLYVITRLPWSITRYRLTNRRITIDRGISWKVEQYVDFDRFDAVEVAVRPGQEWYPAGDVVFRLGTLETLRLLGVRRPEAFRQACLNVQQSFLSVAATIR